MGKLRINSEIGPLRRVITHTPGSELLAVTPSNRDEYLYGDILDLRSAAREHRHFVGILEQFAEVLPFRRLLEETLQRPEARDFLLTRSEEITANRSLRQQLQACSTEELGQRYIEGWRHSGGPFSKSLGQTSYILPPLPNLFFTRDAATVLGEAVTIGAMRYAPRWPEEVLMRTIFGFHPSLEAPTFIYDGSDERRFDYRMEGGDLHPIAPDILLLGLSPRTSPATVDVLTERLFAETAFEHVLAVVIPANTPAIHLDMVWTQIDRDLCVAYPSVFKGATQTSILHLQKGKAHAESPSSLFTALKNLGHPMEPIWAGGPDPEQQERELWTSGCNFFTVRPGITISYARNTGTLEALEKAGFKTIDAEAFVANPPALTPGQKTVITIQGSELVRGGGGPRCMTCPLVRDDM